MKAVLIAIDAKYIHSNPAVRSIAAYARAHSAGRAGVEIAEFTINQRDDYILARLFELQADIYLFSCYIWNIELVRQLAPELRKVWPQAAIWAGGPEVTFHAGAFLACNPAFTLVVRGEGEVTVARLLAGEEPALLDGVTTRLENGEIISSPDAEPPDLDQLPFPYEDLTALEPRLIYYESSRGCPFSCGYCLSSVAGGVRFRDLALVRDDLRRLLNARVRRVKLVDRTFNADPARAMRIWEFLTANDNGVTSFHFELSGELLTPDQIGFLSTVRPGQFQFEIGVQSTNQATLRAIGRSCDKERLFESIRLLAAPGNIHLHLDLIAGLPYESIAGFTRSFNEVYALRPAQLQLGFLKVLHGTEIEKKAARYGILYRDRAPYQVLATKWLPYGLLLCLNRVEQMVERYYNSGRFTYLIAHLQKRCGSPFAFYSVLADFWRERGHEQAPPDKVGQYQLLGDFMGSRGKEIDERAKWLCKYDMALHEKPKRLPAWVDVDLTARHRQALAAFYKRSGGGMLYVERFPFDPRGGQEPVFLCFDYARRDTLGHAHVHALPDHALLPE